MNLSILFKKIIKLTIMITMCILLIGCNKKIQYDVTGKIESVNKDNYNEIISKHFGFEISIPSNYVVTNVVSPNKLTNIIVSIKRNDGISGYEFGKNLYDLTSKISEKEHSGNMNYGRKVYKNYGEAGLNNTSSIVASWFYYQYSEISEKYELRQIMYSCINDTIEISFLKY